jgi:hypothetical protein
MLIYNNEHKNHMCKDHTDEQFGRSEYMPRIPVIFSMFINYIVPVYKLNIILNPVK